MAKKKGIKGIKEKPLRFKVGDWVTYPFRPERALVQIIGYTGPIGHDGGRYYRLRKIYDWGEVKEFEMPEEVLEPAEAPASAKQ